VTSENPGSFKKGKLQHALAVQSMEKS